MGILFIQKRGKKWNFLESYMEVIAENLRQKWLNCFPDIELVFVKIENDYEEFYPGAPCNERSYFNKLRNLKK